MTDVEIIRTTWYGNNTNSYGSFRFDNNNCIVGHFTAEIDRRVFNMILPESYFPKYRELVRGTIAMNPSDPRPVMEAGFHAKRIIDGKGLSDEFFYMPPIAKDYIELRNYIAFILNIGKACVDGAERPPEVIRWWCEK